MNSTNRAIAVVVSVVVVAFCLVYALTLGKPGGFTIGVGANVDQTKSEALQSGDSLTIDAAASSVTVTKDEAATEVTAHFYGSSFGLRIGGNPELTVERSGNAVTIRTGRNWIGIGWNSGMKLDVTVPAGFSGDFDCHSGAGSVNVNSDFSVNSFRAHSSAGAVRVQNVTAEGAVEISSSAGSVEAAAVNAASLDMSSSAGRITLQACKAGTIRLHSSAGSVSAGELRGKVEEASSSAGSVDITLGEIAGDADIWSSAGGVRLTLPAGADARLNAWTSAGSVSVGELALSDMTKKRNQVTGRLGDGGPEIKVHSSAGSVTISEK